jgi:hypothetical protein
VIANAFRSCGRWNFSRIGDSDFPRATDLWEGHGVEDVAFERDLKSSAAEVDRFPVYTAAIKTEKYGGNPCCRTE